MQLADLCGYNVYRAFRNLFSKRDAPSWLSGLKVFPDDSELVEFARKGWIEYKTKQPALL